MFSFYKKMNAEQVKYMQKTLETLHEQCGECIRCATLKESFRNDRRIQENIGERYVSYFCFIANEPFS